MKNTVKGRSKTDSLLKVNLYFQRFHCSVVWCLASLLDWIIKIMTANCIHIKVPCDHVLMNVYQVAQPGTFSLLHLYLYVCNRLTRLKVLKTMNSLTWAIIMLGKGQEINLKVLFDSLFESTASSRKMNIFPRLMKYKHFDLR